MKVNTRKTEYTCVNETKDNGAMRMQGEEMAKVDVLKYLGSSVQRNGEYGRKLKNRQWWTCE